MEFNENIHGTVKIEVRKIHPKAIVPTYEYIDAACFDLYAVQTHKVRPNRRVLIPTGLAFAFPFDYFLRILPRSGHTVKHGIHVGAGVIDSSYRGEIYVQAFNLGQHPWEVRPGDRVAQAVLLPRPTVAFEVVEDLPDSLRGERGFGSSGD